jgi:RNA polymerase sigma factor (TIGR02999 family)
MEPAGEVTALLHAWGAGDRSVESRLFELVLPDLHKLADRMMRRERPDHSLQPTALLNEVYCRLVMARERDWQNRRHFFAVAARAMRRILIDYARSRPKAVRVPAEGLEAWLQGRDEKIELAVTINGLLDEIEASHPDWCSIIELKFFMGFTDQETAEVLGVPLRTAQRRFGDARRWLYQSLESRSCQAKTITTNL